MLHGCANPWQVAHAVLLHDGTPDPTFGTGGYATSAVQQSVDGLTVLPDGKIVVASTVNLDPNDPFVRGIGVTRFDQTGAVDPSFGSGGTTVASFPGRVDVSTGVVLSEDGNLYVGVQHGENYDDGFGLARFTSGGVLDTTFGDGGLRLTHLRTHDSPQGLAVAPDGKLLQFGFSYPDTAGQTSDYAMIRYRANGSVDPSFGHAGKVVQDVGGVDQTPSSVLFLPDRGILLAGSAGPQAAFARFRANGSLDVRFGARGQVTFSPLGGLSAGVSTAAVTPDGNIVALVGVTLSEDPPTFVSLLGRFDGSTGQPDQSFGDKGFVQLAPAPGRSIVVDGDGNATVPILQLTPEGIQSILLLQRYLGGAGAS